MELIGRTLGQYRIIEKVGQGGMATVFKAYQPNLDRFVAIKIMAPQHAQTHGFKERFFREAKAVAMLSHPNILQVYDVGMENDISYIVMKYIAGTSMREILGQQMDLGRACRFIEQIAGALDHAHDNGIIHRDIKSANLLVEGDWVLIADFGIAKIVEGSTALTCTGELMGSPAYMSPEQASGKPMGHYTDIYSLGIVLYEMLTGQVPFKGETPYGVMFKHVNDPLPLPRILRPDLPERVELVILKALAKVPEHRYERAGQLAEALREAVASAQGASESLPVLGSVESKDTPANLLEDVADSSQPAGGISVPMNGAGSHPVSKTRAMDKLILPVIIAIVLIIAGIAVNQTMKEQGGSRSAANDTKQVVSSSQDRSNMGGVPVAKAHAPGEAWLEPVTGMEMVWVPGGCYQMGCGSWTSDCDSDENPVHEVCVDGFWMGKYEVTQGEWQKMMGSNPSQFKKGDRYPVEKVSRDNIQNFIRKLKSANGGKYDFRLPSEAEWEYACRSGGKSEKYSGGDSVDTVAWNRSNSGSSTHSVGTKSANGLGIFDMSGNVYEWVEDIYDESAYGRHERKNPIVASGGSDRVGRGGSWNDHPGDVRCANRSHGGPASRDNYLGFRLARTD